MTVCHGSGSIIAMRKLILFFLLVTACLPAADLSGKWNFVWQTEGGERRTTLTVTIDNDKVTAQFPEGKTPINGTFAENKLNLAGKLYSSEAGQEGEFRLNGVLDGDQLKGTAAWDEHEMTFTAKRAQGE